MEIQLKYTPTEKQAYAHRCPAKYMLFGGAIGGGKSAFLVNHCQYKALTLPGSEGFIGRWENVTFMDTTFLELEKFLAEDAVALHNKSKQFIQYHNGSRLWYGGLKSNKSAKESSNWDRIKSKTLCYFAVDEASEMPRSYWDALCSRLRQPEIDPFEYQGILASNPEQGWLREVFIDKQKKNHKFIPSFIRDNPHLPVEYENELRDIFPGSWVQQYIEGSWDIGADKHFFPYDWVIHSMEAAIESKGSDIQYGVDVGRGGDQSIVAKRVGNEFEFIYSSRKNDLMEVVGEIASLMDQDNLVVVDSVGLGAGVHDRLKEQGYNVGEFIAGAAPVEFGYESEDESKTYRFANLKAQAYWRFREALKSKAIKLPNDPELRSQLLSINFSTRSDRKLLIESKEQLRSRGGSSPDKAEAIIMANGAIKEVLEPAYITFSEV